MNRKIATILFIGLAVGVTGLDLWSKTEVAEFLKVQTVADPEDRPVVIAQDRHTVIKNWFQLEYTYNYGAFSGWFRKHTGVLAILSAVALVVIAIVFFVYLYKTPSPELLVTLPLGLLWGGTCGNFYDRAQLGGVRDWVKWFVVIDGKEHVWPNFNLADAAICVAVSLLIIREVRTSVRTRDRGKAEAVDAR